MKIRNILLVKMECSCEHCGAIAKLKCALDLDEDQDTMEIITKYSNSELSCVDRRFNITTDFLSLLHEVGADQQYGALLAATICFVHQNYGEASKEMQEVFFIQAIRNLDFEEYEQVRFVLEKCKAIRISVDTEIIEARLELRLRNYGVALNLFEGIFKHDDDVDEIALRNVYSNIAVTYIHLSQFIEAKRYIKRSLRIEQWPHGVQTYNITIAALSNFDKRLDVKSKHSENMRICMGCKTVAEGLSCCKACTLVHYCNEECQTKHWPVHEKECKKYRMCQQCHKIEENMKHCGRCKNAWYCSIECQKEDWEFHETECQNFLSLHLEKCQKQERL